MYQRSELGDLSHLKSVGLIGGAGFIGSHFADALLGSSDLERLVVFDNFSSGREWHLISHENDPRLSVIRGDVRDVPALIRSLDGCQTIVHLASNPDIAAAASNPAIDFDQGTFLTHCVVEAARTIEANQILYASGSGVYGDLGDFEADEDFGPLIPVSTYAASKLAGEALLSSYAHMFGIQAIAFRFGNVVGARQTHGVGFDFLRKLRVDRSDLMILGDGTQSKSYIYVGDVVRAVLMASRITEKQYDVFNVATLDYLTVNEIARIAIEVSELEQSKVRIQYSGGNRGWKGDVPVVRLASRKIRELGWESQLSSAEAIERSLNEMNREPRIFSE